MKLCILSQQHFKNKHVSEDTVEAFENAILSICEKDRCLVKLSEFCYKINRKLNNKLEILDLISMIRIKKYNPDVIFIMAMSPEIIANQLSLLKKFNTIKVVYCIDTWGSRVEEWKSILKKAKINTVFCVYKASVPIFKEFINNVFYLPYSMNEKWFYPREDIKKTHLFMQMGRKNKTLHEYALKYISEKKLSDKDYIREKQKGQIIYPQFSQLAEEINKTKFFILAPRDIDEYNVTGAVSDVTARFYEGMACKTLLIGYKPKDSFDLLFPNKHAMITFSDYEDFRNKVDYYLEHEGEYLDIINENYKYLMKHHTWYHRADKLFQCLEQVLLEEK